MSERKPYFPMFIDLSEKKVTVVGGGKIAGRRVDTLLKFTENITVVAPEAVEEIRQAARQHRLRWVKEAFEACPDSVLEGADMVLAATNDKACNERIAKLCKARGIPVNVSHKKELCDFYFPAVVVQENVVAGMTSSGLDHSQARQVRERVERAFTKEPPVQGEQA